MKVEGGGHYLRAVNDGARKVIKESVPSYRHQAVLRNCGHDAI